MYGRVALQLLCAANLAAAFPQYQTYTDTTTVEPTTTTAPAYYYPSQNSSRTSTSYETSFPTYTYTRGGVYPNGTGTRAATNTYVPPTRTQGYTPNPTVFRTACAEIASAYTSRLLRYEREAATDTDAIYPTRVPIRIREAWDCQYSIPINVEITLDFIAGLKKYLNFQSTIEYLKNPPEGSLQDPVDIIGSLDALAEQVQSGEIAHHIRFENAVTQLLQRCHDGHLAFSWNSRSLFTFRGPFSLLSLSTDGLEKPKVFVEDDALEFGTEAAWITRIDGFEVEAWLAEWADFGSSQSPDARYNSIFANRDPGSDGTFFNLYGWYPGKNTISITFSNSTTKTYPYRAYARWSQALNWTGITDGSDFYRNIVLNPAYFPTEESTPTRTPARTPTPTPDSAGNGNYHVHDKRQTRSMRVGTETSVSTLAPTSTPSDLPQLVYFNQPYMRHRVGPYVQDLNGIIGGYFLNDTIETAVLDISSFSADDDDAEYEIEGFQAALEEFFAEARRRESKRLVIDVRGNGGGLIALGFELYKQLFPSGPANSYFRMRAHEAAQIFAYAAEGIATEAASLELIRRIQTEGPENVTDDESLAVVRAIVSGFSRQNLIDIKGNTPEDVPTLMGPYNLTDGAVRDQVSLLVQSNFSFPLGGTDISGFGTRANLTNSPQPFRKEDILLLSDGTCASTCTIFGELLKREQANVSTIVMGGRPNDAPSAHIGGTHGSRVLRFADLLSNSRRTVQVFPPENDEEEQYLVDNIPLALPFGFTYAAINFRDAIRPEDESQTPLQFALEPADCRLYFSHIGFSDSVYLWGELSALKWGTNSNFTGCAVGGLQRGEESTGDIPDDPETIEIVNYVLQGLN